MGGFFIKKNSTCCISINNIAINTFWFDADILSGIEKQV